MIIGANSCRSCAHRRVVDREVFCYRYPPIVLVVPMPGPKGTPIPGFQSCYPRVDPDAPCGEYTHSAVNAAEVVAEATRGFIKQ